MPKTPRAIPLAPNKSGRPRKLTPTPDNLKALEGLGRIQCTTREGAAYFKVSEPTYLKFLADFPEAAEAIDAGKGMGRVSLRRLQFEMAKKHAVLCIFLGKQYLGQRDRQELTGADGGPIQYANMSEADIDARLAALAAQYGPAGPTD